MPGGRISVLWQDKANPRARVLSAAMPLRYGLGEENVAKRIEAAVIETLNRAFRAGDIFSTGMATEPFIPTRAITPTPRLVSQPGQATQQSQTGTD